MQENKETTYIGIATTGGEKGIQEFFQFTCPCGVVATFPLNEVPTKDTPHPCGNPKHWAVKIYE